MKTHTLPSTLGPREIAAIEEYLRRLREQWPDRIAHVWLYGSTARGEAGLESDIDLLVVARTEDWEFEKALNRIALEVDLAYGVVLSDHLVNLARFRQMAVRQEPLYHSIERDGIDLWSRELQPTI